VIAPVLCVDVGSTFTKGVLVDPDGGAVLATASRPTTWRTDVLEGIDAVRAAVQDRAGAGRAEVLACSSAGGGLRIAVVGYERLVTAEAGHRVALTAGGRVVHLHAGPLDAGGVAALRAARPDVVLLVGGTDGGDADVVLHNAGRLARTRIAAPVVYAGNADAAGPARDLLAATGRRVTVAANVLPRIGVLDPQPARAAIREVFLRHVIGGKGLSRGPAFARMVRAATPDAVLAGVEVLADGAPGVPGTGDVLVVDVGGATTDVCSALSAATLAPAGSLPRGDVVAALPRARSVEGDLGMRWSAPGVVAAAGAEGLLAGLAPERLHRLEEHARRCADTPDLLAGTAAEAEDDALLAAGAVTVAVRRHARPATPSAGPRPLGDVRWVVGSGGVFRHGDDALRRAVLAPLLADHAGAWRVPRDARLAVDADHLLFAAGLLAARAPAAAAALAGACLHEVPT